MSQPTTIGFRITTHTPRPSTEALAGFRGVPTGNVCDAMDRLMAMDYRIKPLDPALPRRKLLYHPDPHSAPFPRASPTAATAASKNPASSL